MQFRNLDIINITGGEHHSIALTSDGKVFAWGRNDDGQLGIGENWIIEYKDIIEE